jgi:hypothetical protein
MSFVAAAPALFQTVSTQSIASAKIIHFRMFLSILFPHPVRSM